MCMSLRRRLSIRAQRNRILIYLAIILAICIYLTTDSIEKSENERNNTLINLLKNSQCPQLSRSSQGYFHVDFPDNSSINHSLICKTTDILLIYILSTAKNFQRRESIRRTWARKKDYQQLNETCFIFIVGLSTDDSRLPYHGDIQREAAIYGDIVQLNIKETYQNVVYKEVGALKWSYIYASQIPFLFKTDDDLVLDSLLLSDIVKFLIHNRTDHSIYLQKHQEMKKFVQEMSDVDRYTLFKGKDFRIVGTRRSGKFGIHHLAWNHEFLPPYCSGFGFLYSSFIRDRLYRASLCYGTEYVPLVGDVFLSGFIAGAASVRCSGWALMHIQTGDSCASLYQKHSSLLVCSTPLHRGRQIFSDFDAAWLVISNRHPSNLITTTTTTTVITETTATAITTTTMSNHTSLFNRSQIILGEAIRNFTENKELIKQNFNNETYRIFSENFFNRTNLTGNRTQVIKQ